MATTPEPVTLARDSAESFVAGSQPCAKHDAHHAQQSRCASNHTSVMNTGTSIFLCFTLLVSLGLPSLRAAAVEENWVRLYNGPAGSADAGRRVAAVPDGNIVAGGWSRADNIRDDFYTAKYSAADGAILWERRCNGPGNDQDDVRDLAVDANGDVFVTGYSVGAGGTAGDIYTAKYRGADGVILWEQRFNGPGNAGDVPYMLAVDGNGDVVVTGTCAGIGANNDEYSPSNTPAQRVR